MMGSDPNIPWPTEWRHIRRTKIVLIGAAAMLIFILAPLTIYAYTMHDVGRLLVISLFSISLSLAGVVAYLTTGTCSNRTSSAAQLVRLLDGTFATTMRDLRTASVLSSVMLLLFSCAFITLPALMELYTGMSTRQEARLRTLSLVSPLPGVLLLAWVFSRMMRKRALLGVGLSPAGIYHWSDFGCCFYAWDWIAGVQPASLGVPRIELTVVEPEDRGRDPEENFLGQLQWFRRRNRRIEVHHLRVNPGAVYLAVVFYLRHPEHSHELSTMDGVRRIQNLDFGNLVHELETTGTLRATAEPA